MGSGKLSVEAHTANGALPVRGASVVVSDEGGHPLYYLMTDESGKSGQVSLYAPDKSFTYDPGNTELKYGKYIVTVTALGFITEVIKGVQIYDTIDAIMPVNLQPLPESASSLGMINETEIPAPAVEGTERRHQEDSLEIVPAAVREVIIPDYITVHLGTPNASARNVRVPFIDYIKNVASSEIYPTWPQSSLEANIYAIITFALNRVFTEWYRSRNFPFDITNSTAFDMAFVENRDIFSSISQIVDEIFNQYARRQGRREPFFTQFCNGTTSTCPGLSQWGTVTLANQGLAPLQILHHYYPNDLEIVESNNIAGITESYPGTPLKQGDQNENVRTMQRYLNRIRADYPLIPQITNPNGFFGSDTANSVRAFQRIFNLVEDGVIGKSTWNKIVYLFVAVARLAELNSEGIHIGIGTNPPTSVLRLGSRGEDVARLQFLINFFAEFYPSIPPVIQDSTFGASTQSAVRAFQSLFHITPDGVVGPSTWNKAYEIFRTITNNVEIPSEPETPTPTPPFLPPYPGYLLRLGSSGDSVRTLQTNLNVIANANPTIPSLNVDGIFGPATQAAVVAFQRLFNLAPDGIVGPLTWDRVMREAANQSTAPTPPETTYPAFPGYYIAMGSSGSNVSLIQQKLNDIAKRYSSIPKVSVDGIFGVNTQNAVKAFQRQFGLTDDGIVGELTWNRIMQEHARL